jgi:hypothetical protein
MLWRPKDSSPTWRSFLHNHMHCLAAIDMFVVVTDERHLRSVLSSYSLVTVAGKSIPRSIEF